MGPILKGQNAFFFLAAWFFFFPPFLYGFSPKNRDFLKSSRSILDTTYVM